MIIGEIRRYLRDNNSVRVSRSMRDIAYKAMQIKEKIMAESDHEPSVEEVAKKLDIKRKHWLLLWNLSWNQFLFMSQFF